MSLPSPILERLLRRLLGSAPSTPFVLGDLREEYARVRAERGHLTAWIWYLVHALRLGLRVRWNRYHTAAPSGARRIGTGDSMKSELRQALRFLRRRPAFSAAIVLTVALAIAATTLAFAVVDGVLLEPLPYENPERLVSVWEHNTVRDRDRNVVSPANFFTWGDELRSFDRLASIVEASTTLRTESGPERIGYVQASATYFEMVGARPLIGRLYTPEDDVEGAPAVTVLSEGYWRRRFGADPSIIGRDLTIGADPMTVVGVLPDRFDYEVRAVFNGVGTHDLWVPPQFPAAVRDRGGRYLEVLGRLAPGATVESAQREASALAARLRQEFPERQAGWDVNVISLTADLVGSVRTTILVVFGAVCFVLLIACANVANLLMTRATERQQEMAVRSALGAGRRRLFAQVLSESMILSVIGGGLGVALAAVGLRSLVAGAPDIPRLDAVGMDASVAGFALLATLGTALLFGVAPALHMAGADVAGWLKERTSSGRRSALRIRGALVVAQIALSLVLLIGAGLLVRSLVNRMDVGVGFDVRDLLTAELQLPGDYDTARQIQFFEQLVERIDALPGVRDASAITWVPLAGGGTATSFHRLDQPLPEPGQSPTADIRWVHRDYFDVMGIPLVQGRVFDARDHGDAPLAVVITDATARLFYPGENPIGKRLAMPWGDTLHAEIIGVVADIRTSGPDTEPRAMLYWDHRQHRAFAQMTIVARTDGPPADVVRAMRAEVAAMDASLPLYNVRSMGELFGTALARARFTTFALALFAALALILAAIGIYGVMAYATQQRAQEIGIRMALGADRGSVVRMVIRQGILQVAVALVLGTVAAFGLSRLLQSLVFGVSTTDAPTFAVMGALLGLIALGACWLPARRASGINPVSAIRSE